jgi:hypothetical protein
MKTSVVTGFADDGQTASGVWRRLDSPLRARRLIFVGSAAY